ncbi:MAG: hypothetical protein ACXWM7_06760 [Parachlamydiaceae bacterium]
MSIIQFPKKPEKTRGKGRWDHFAAKAIANANRNLSGKNAHVEEFRREVQEIKQGKN